MKFLKKLWQAMSEEREFMKAVAVFCTACTFFMILFVNEEPFFDALMIFLNGLIIAAALEED